MNWVGGSRSRLVMKNDAKKQREFFERRKMQQRLRNLGVALPASPGRTTCGSMDLVTLFIVNQIAAKKEKTDPPKVSVFGSPRGGSSSRYRRSEALLLPMSPCSPSQLDFVEGHSSSIQGARKGRNIIPHGFKSRQLSPVLESAFSDVSASDYLPQSADPHSPFSSISLASSGKVNLGRASVASTEILPLQQRSQTLAQFSHYSPPPWESSGLPQIKFQPFPQTEGVTDGLPWSDRPNTPICQLETPTAAQALFGSQDQGITEARDFAEHQVTFSLNQSEDTEPMLDFTFSQSENEQQVQDDVFRGFSTADCREEAFLVGSDNSKIYDETPVKSSAPQTVPDLQGREMTLSKCTDMSCSHLEQSFGPLGSTASSPSYPCSRGYLSSDSDDDQHCCHPCHPSASVHVDQRCDDEYHSNPGLQDNAKQGRIHLRLPTPPLKPQRSFSANQQVMECVARLDKDGGTSQQSGGSTVCFESPEACGQTLRSELCKYKTAFRKTLDKRTQTDEKPPAETCDASTQCSFVQQRVSEAKFSLCLPPFGVSVRDSATRRQSSLTSQSPSKGNMRNEEKHLPWNSERSTTAPPLDNNTRHRFCALDENGLLQMPIDPLQEAWGVTGSRGEKKSAGEENGRLMTDESNEVREEVTSTMKVNRLSEETQTLQEIADILLQLKQRQGDGC